MENCLLQLKIPTTASSHKGDEVI